MNSQQLDFSSPAVIVAVAVGCVVLLLLLVIWRKGRPFSQEGSVFRASRLSSGNHLFPTQVQITPTAIVHYTPHWFGRSEHSIHTAHIASVRIDTGFLLSDVYIETSGGASPIKCHGHRKGDAVEMQRLIEQFQSAYYRQTPPPPQPPPSTVAQNETRR